MHMEIRVTKYYRGAWLLGAAFLIAAGSQAEAGWKMTKLVPNVPGTLASVALNDSGVVLTSFVPKGWTSTIGAWAGVGSFAAFSYCGAGGSTVPTAFGAD